MSKPVEHNGERWLQQPDGSWSKWNGNTNSWEPYAPVGAEQAAAPAAHQPAQQPPAQWPPQPGTPSPSVGGSPPNQGPGRSFGARAWRGFRSLPLWVQIIIIVLLIAFISAPFTQEEPDDTSAVGVNSDEEQEEPAPPEEKPRVRGRLTDY